MGRLAGKVAFITGGGGGIGSAAALRFAEEGAKVVVAGRNEATAQASATAALKRAGAGGDAIALACDVTDKASVAAAIAATVARFGKLDILYNNAGGSSSLDGPVSEAPEEEFWRAIKVDLYGTFICCKLAIPEMIKAGGGAIINTSSIMAIQAVPGRDCYTAAKGGIAALTRSMAIEYAPYKIRVNALAPAITLTERVKGALVALQTFPALDRLMKSQVLGGIEPVDVANMALYLASDEARTITGQVQPVCAGASVY